MLAMDRYLCGSLDDSFCDLGLATDADGVILADFLDELVFRHGLGGMVDVPALGAECLDCLLADVLDEEDAQVLVVDGVQDPWHANGPDSHRFLASNAVV